MKVTAWAEMDSKKKLFILIAILLVAGSIASQNRPVDSPENAETVKERKIEKAKIEIAVAGASMLKKSARNPDSFKVSSVTVMQDGTVCYEYRAQNGFGGMSVENATFDPSTLKIMVTGSKGFVPTWNKKCAGKTGQDFTPDVSASI